MAIFLIAFMFSLLTFLTPTKHTHSSEPEPPPLYESSDFARYVPDGPDVIPMPSASPTPSATPTASPTQKPKPKSTPRPITRTRTGSIRGWLTGTATWYCEAGVSRCPKRYPDRAGIADLYAAAGPALRRAFDGKWRGRHVLVCKGKTCVEVKLVDWCACGHGRVIDLFGDAFKQLAPLSRGEIRVAVDIP